MNDYEKVECKECKKYFYKITNTHLWKQHHMTVKEYSKKYPDDRLEDINLSLNRGNYTRDKTYEEIYGNERSNKLKEEKSKSMTKYRLIEKKCKICQKFFVVKENNRQIYCSIKCSYEGLRVEKKIIKCFNCGKDMIVYPSTEKKYCSDKCRIKYKYKKSMTDVCCALCGKLLNIRISTIQNKNVFCSKECKTSYGILKRKGDYRTKAYLHYGKICSRCNSTKNLLIHHIDGNRLNNSLENLQILCRSCHSKLHINTVELQKSFVGEGDIENGMILILQGLRKAFGLDISNENFRLTPKRVARAYYEIFKGINAKEEIKDMCETSFPSNYNGMIIIKDIKVFSMCPHHFLPVEYIVNVGYIPNKKTVGISKLSRVVEILSKQPELQEIFTKSIANILQNELNPKGVIVQVKGRHFCMVMRGIKKDSWTMTSTIEGVFDRQKVREEFMLLLNQK